MVLKQPTILFWRTLIFIMAKGSPYWALLRVLSPEHPSRNKTCFQRAWSSQEQFQTLRSLHHKKRNARAGLATLVKKSWSNMIISIESEAQKIPELKQPNRGPFNIQLLRPSRLQKRKQSFLGKTTSSHKRR